MIAVMEISIPAPRPKFPDYIAASAPIGMREKIRRVARLTETTASAFIREAVQERLRLVEGAQNSLPDASGFRPNLTLRSLPPGRFLTCQTRG